MTGKPFHICEGVLGARPSWPFIMKTERNLPPFLPSRKSGCQIASGKVEQISRIKAMAEISDTSVKWVDHETAVKPPEPPGKSQLWCQSKHDAADRRGNTFPILSLKWMLPRLCSWRQNGESKYCDLLFVFNAQMGGFFFWHYWCSDKQLNWKRAGGKLSTLGKHFSAQYEMALKKKPFF